MDECKAFDPTITDTSLAQAYIPIQKMCELTEPVQGLLAGTIFPELIDFYK
ncbi:MAG: spore coat associated protein CotJA [Firmicutes bacterium]|nr:spore coat associated protein CotJA [Bacillota bacterium]